MPQRRPYTDDNSHHPRQRVELCKQEQQPGARDFKPEIHNLLPRLNRNGLVGEIGLIHGNRSAINPSLPSGMSDVAIEKPAAIRTINPNSN